MFDMNKVGLILLVILLTPSVITVAGETRSDVEVRWKFNKRTTIDPSSLKVFVDNEDKCLYLDFRENFAPLTVEIKNTKNQIVFRSVVYPTAIGEYTLSFGNIPLGQYELSMYNSEVKVQGSFNL